MELNLNNITFIIVSFKSEKVIDDCLKSLPKNSKIIVIENSNNYNLKKSLELKYDNIEVLISENNGMGASNNLGILKSETKFAYVLNPDAKFKKDTFENLVVAASKITDFAILTPLNSNTKFPNFKIFKQNKNINDNIISVDSIVGFSMLINKEKFVNKKFFDENIFLYLEDDDLCFRAKKNGQKIFVIKNSIIEHEGSSSSSIKNDPEFEYLRNWHWMWSKYYFNKKHYGAKEAIKKVFFNFISASLKYIIYSISFNKHMKKIYQMRLCGLTMSFLGKRSFLRPKD
tara:strand:+ start:142 stop:1002 length:861 start_codon:yes stop_codon:yes gene_type:complete